VKNHLIISCILIFALASACTITIGGPNAARGSGRVTTEDRAVSGFQAVSLELPGDLTISLGDKEALQVEGEDNLLPYIETDVSNGRLRIRITDNANILPTRGLRFRLVAIALDSLEDTSLGTITAPALKADRFMVKISSAGSVNLAGLEASTLNATLSSLGSLEISSGQVGQQNITISSSGSYKGGDVRSQSAVVRLSSLGSATLWVTDRLEAHLSSTGSVNYYGKPQVTKETTSLGKVISLGNK
jgi:hypothetical protein